MSSNNLASSFNFRHFKRLRIYWRGQARSGAEVDNIDLDLLAAGLLYRGESADGRVLLAITQAGQQAMALRHEEERLRRKPRAELAGRLTQWLRDQGRVTWEDIEMVVRDGEGQLHTVKPSVFSVATAFSRKKINPMIHVVLNDHEAFSAELRHVARQALYVRLAEQVVYVAPAGSVSLDEVPSDCGLLVEDELGKFRQLKLPRSHPVTLTAHNFMSLILKPGAMSERSSQVAPALKRLSAKGIGCATLSQE